MTASTRIPFGLHVESGNIVSAHQVPSGLSCGCICVSCELPLIARKGKQLIWHFAHAPVDSGQSDVNELCEYSLFLTLRKMAQQEMVRRSPVKDFQLPGYVIKDHRLAGTVPTRKHVTKPSKVTLDCISADKRIENASLDVLTHVNSTPLGIRFTYPGRHTVEDRQFTHGKYGVISIDLTPLDRIGEHTNDPTDYVMAYLTNNTASKRWLYHPREQAIRSELERDLAIQRQQLQAEEDKKIERQKRRALMEKKIEEQRQAYRKKIVDSVTVQKPSGHRAPARAIFHCSDCNCWFIPEMSRDNPPCHQCGRVDNVHPFKQPS